MCRIHKSIWYNTNPVLLIAHAYTCYLGDLSGGQALKRIVRSALKLQTVQSTEFYEFEQLPTVEAKLAFKGWAIWLLKAVGLAHKVVMPPQSTTAPKL
ncbi:biliverdin-producing heme oxygenase [Cyanobacteria bacterium FACHB-DQ100]|nr:biliverdin-producing heme oxygenase [Cyanobacteria bacterium FACHB-DQ100]